MRVLNVFGAAFAAAGICALAACGGGGGHAASPLVPAATATPVTNNPAVSGTSRVTFTIHRTAASAHAASAAKRYVPRILAKTAGAVRSLPSGRIVSSARRPKLFSPSALGLAITVAQNGGPLSSTTYADISTSSPLCTTNPDGTLSTCSVTIPNVATSETITAQEVDTTPSSENAGYGNGFSDAGILGASTTAATIASASGTPISMTLGPVVSQVLDADGGGQPPADASGSFFAMENSGGGRFHIVVGSGQIASGYSMYLLMRDVDTNNFTGVAGTPLVDVNGAPTAVTMTSSVPGLTFYAEPDGNVQTVSPAYAQQATISDSGAQDADPFGDGEENVVIRVAYDGTPFTSGSAIVTNNLVAVPPAFAFGSQAAAYTYLITSVSASPSTPSVPVGGNVTITGTDPSAGDGMLENDTFGDINQCEDSGGNIIASVSSGVYDSASGTQQYSVSGLSAGTCTMYFLDYDSFVAATPVTLTVTGV